MKLLKALKRKKLIKDLKLKREAFKKQLETFQAILDINDEKVSINAIQNLLCDLEEEYIAFKSTQSKLDDMDGGQILQERIDLKNAFNICKGRAQDIIETTKIRTSESLCSKKEEISAEEVLHQKSIFPDMAESVSCCSPIIHNVKKSVLSADQNTEDNFESETRTKSLQSMMIDISNISKMNFHQNMSMFNTVSSSTLPAPPQIDNTIAKDDSLEENILTMTLQFLERAFLPYCCYSRICNLKHAHN